MRPLWSVPNASMVTRNSTGSAAVRGNELVVVEADHVTILLGNDLRNIHELSRAIRQEHRHGEDAIALDKAVLAPRLPW